MRKSKPLKNMTNEFENENSLNLGIEDISNIDDLDVLKEKYNVVASKTKEAEDKNRHLFERTKKAEGELKELKAKEEKPKAKSEKSDEKLLERLDTMALRMAGITADDEKEFVNKWKQDNGYENVDTDTVLSKRGLQTELADFRTSKANTAVTSNVRGEGPKSEAKDDPAYWIAKATKDSEGNPVFPDDMPKDFKLRAAIIEKMVGSVKSDKQFYNS